MSLRETGPGSSALPRKSTTVPCGPREPGDGQQGGSEEVKARGSELRQTNSAGTSKGTLGKYLSLRLLICKIRTVVMYVKLKL